MSSFADSLGSRYTVEETFVGGQAIVHKAMDKNLNRAVAIKTPNETVLNSPASLEKFIEEARLLGAFKHKNILEVYHFYEQGEIDARCHLVTEWMDQTLQHAIEEDSLPQERRLDVIIGILRGLIEMHKKGIVHRDIKPANIFLSANGSEVRIGDLGIASDVGDDPTLKATPKYVAPENYRTDVDVDQRSDIYSLGILAYELLLGKTRFEQAFAEIYSAANEKNRIARWLNWHLDVEREVPPANALATEISPAVGGVIARMMSKDRDRRYATAEAALEALEQSRHAGAATTATALEPLPLPGEEKKRFFLLRPAGLVTMSLVVLLGVLGAILFAPQPAPPNPEREAALQAREQMLMGREAAVAAGAELAPVIGELTNGDELYAQARNLFESQDYTGAAARVGEASQAFYRAEALGLQRRAEAVLDEAERLGVLDDYPSLIEARGLLEQANQLVESGTLRDATPVFASSLAALADAIRRAPRAFTAGSDSGAIEAAVRLCSEYVATCEARWYETELQRETELAPFEIDAGEVTMADFERFVEATGYQTVAEERGFAVGWDGTMAERIPDGTWHTVYEGRGLNAPAAAIGNDEAAGEASADTAAAPLAVGAIALRDAREYCQWNGARLPSEDEWEYAARGGDGRAFPWGDEWIDTNAIWDNGVEPPALPHVGSLSGGLSPLGAHDMAGGVWEWVTTDANEAGAALKGGSWLERNPANLRSAARRSDDPELAYIDNGFRCARDSEQWTWENSAWVTE